ncbi:MAG: alpha/beta fold hydrolase [Bacteroidetes bacterium]|nr:alpha/beta fold hydrolase [Bacteroidota bacterium]
MKKAIILLHGYCESGKLWNNLAGELNNEFRVFTPDIAGHGANSLVVNSIPEMATNIIRQITEESIDQFCIIGHSMGGYVTLEILKQIPDRCLGAGLFHSHAEADSPDRKENRNKGIKHLEQYGSLEYLKSMAMSMLSSDHANSDDWFQQAYEQVKSNRSDGLIHALMAMRDRESQMSFISNMNKPLLWVAGKNDSFFSLEDILQQASHSRLSMVHILEESGHLGMIEEPEKSLQIIRDFANWCYSFSVS